jgi:hypothetical protein
MGRVHRDVLDKGLIELATYADRVYICWSVPADYNDAVSLALGSQQFGAGAVFGGVTAVTGGRQVKSGLISGSATVTGTARHWAAVDSTGKRLLATDDMTPTAVTAGSSWPAMRLGVAMQFASQVAISGSPAAKTLTLAGTPRVANGPVYNTPTNVAGLTLAGVSPTSVIVINSPTMSPQSASMSTKPFGRWLLLMHFDDDLSDVAGNYQVLTNSFNLWDVTNHAFGDPYNPTYQYAALQSSLKKFGKQALFIPYGTYLNVNTATPDFGFGLGDFTIDFWCVQTANSGANSFSFDTTDPYLSRLTIQSTWGVMSCTTPTVNYGVSYGTVPAPWLWSHYALTRKNGVIHQFINGVDATETANGYYRFPAPGGGGYDTNTPPAATNFIGQVGYPIIGDGFFVGWIDEIRVIAGYAAWTSDFTPPTAPYTPTDSRPSVVQSSVAFLPPAAALTLGSPPGIGILLHFDDNINDAFGRYRLTQSNINVYLDTTWKKFGTKSLRILPGTLGPFNRIVDCGWVANANASNFDGWRHDLILLDHDFTIDFWLYLNSTTIPNDSAITGSPPQGASILDWGNYGQTDYYTTPPAGVTYPFLRLYIDPSAKLIYYTMSAVAITGPTMAINTEYHIAITRKQGQTRMFVNGSQVGSTFSDSTIYMAPFQSLPYMKIGAGGGFFNVIAGWCAMDGWIDEFRILNGNAVWTANFTPPTQAYDAHDCLPVFYFKAPLSYTVPSASLKLQGFGGVTNGFIMHFDTDFNDITGHVTISQLATDLVTLDTSVKKFGVASAYFDGNVSSGLLVQGNAVLNFLGDFCADLWYKPITTISGSWSTSEVIFGNWPASGTVPDGFGMFRGINSTNVIGIWTDSSSFWTIVGSTSILPGNWYHLALTRSGDTLRLFVNGYLDGLAVVGAGAMGSADQMWIVSNSTQPIVNGWLDEFHIVNGRAVWETNFTPPTAPYTMIDSTSTLVTIS